MDRVRDKVALVFGAGSAGPGWGNGKAAAVLYAREGASLVIVDIDPAAAEGTREVIAREGGTVTALQGDVTDEGDVARIVATAVAIHGRIDILHNNVGHTDMGEIEEVTQERWRETIDINLTSVFLTCKHVLPVMLDRKRGSIVNISALAATRINDYPYYAYYASKAGLNHLTRALAVRYAAEGIRVNVVMPGTMHTPLIYKQIVDRYDSVDAMIAARDASIPMRQMGDAWDVAQAALFLASDDAKYITGVCLPVDGGLSCR